MEKHNRLNAFFKKLLQVGACCDIIDAMKQTIRKNLKTAVQILTAVMLCISAASYFSFRYFHLFGHIASFPEAVLCLLQWVKLAGLVMLPAAVYLKTERFTFAIQWFLIPASLLSLCFSGVYMSAEHVPVDIQQELYPALVNFMPDALTLTLLILEAVFMAACAVLSVLTAPSRFIGCSILKQSMRIPRARHSVQSFFWVMLATMPLSLFDNLIRLLPQNSGFYQFLLFKNFTVWHFLAFAGIFAATYCAYRILKKKDSAARHRYLTVFAIALLVQYFSKASRLVGDGYNVYYTVLAFIPLFICNIGVLVAALAIFTRNRVLRDISFFVHAAGALTVFFYFGKNDMSNYGTVFSYSFLYFAFTHAALYVLCVLPVILGEHKFILRRALIPMAYYAVVIIIAAVASELITAITGSLYGAEAAIRPNYAFSQNCPIPVQYPAWNVQILGMTFNLFYLPVLFLSYVIIFLAHYAGYCLWMYVLKRFKKKGEGAINEATAE